MLRGPHVSLSRGGPAIADLSILIIVVLAAFGLAGGIGITAIGPGGVLPTVGLVMFTDLTPAQVAGTAIVTHVATGALGTAAYARSGQLRSRQSMRTATLLAVTAAVGTPLGIVANSLLSPRAFGVVLGLLLAIVAVLVLLRQRTDETGAGGRTLHHPPAPLVGAIGLLVALAAGIIGIGGPMLTVPLLVAAGTDMLESLAAAQVQSVIIAGVGAVGYVARGSIDWGLAMVVGVPELAGVLIGWRIARALPTRTLRTALVTAMFALAPYLMLHG
ncbi:sulfite exporter TauE/SafE family protein [Flexivirga lutea]